MTNLYYLLKPLLPRWVRITARRRLASWLRRRHHETWPILESSATPPDGWMGWPNGKKFAFVVTHDVERAEGLARCQKLADLDKSLGIPASFNFVPEGEYRISDELRQMLQRQGFEIGIHDLRHDGSLYRSAKRFREQAGHINTYLKSWGVWGFRSGFMLHNLDWIQDLDLLYDASTFDNDPFEPQPDGVGTIFPFWVQSNGVKGYVEMPYTLAQDFTLFVLLKEATIDLWLKKLDWVAEHGGMALVITHPDYMCFDGKPTDQEYPVDFYARLLKYVMMRYGDDCWFATPREVAVWVANNRSQVGQRSDELHAQSKIGTADPERGSFVA
jgi:hypothetical protein